MSPRRKNLLEAFKRSDAPGASPAGAPASHDAPPPRATLFETAAAAPRSGGFRAQPAWALAAVGVVLAFVLGFVLGRNSGSEARAEGPDVPETTPSAAPLSQPRAFQEPPSAGDEAGEPKRIEESPLFDPKNVWTVVVATYTNANPDPAWATYEHLRDAKLAVFPPVASRNLVVVLVGAAPTAAELEKTRDAVRALERNGKKPYFDAYCARIETLIPRTSTKGN